MPIQLKYEDGIETQRETVGDYILCGGILGRTFRESSHLARVVTIIGSCEASPEMVAVEEHCCDDVNKYKYGVKKTSVNLVVMQRRPYFEATPDEIAMVRSGAHRLPRLLKI